MNPVVVQIRQRLFSGVFGRKPPGLHPGTPLSGLFAFLGPVGSCVVAKPVRQATRKRRWSALLGKPFYAESKPEGGHSISPPPQNYLTAETRIASVSARRQRRP